MRKVTNLDFNDLEELRDSISNRLSQAETLCDEINGKIEDLLESITTDDGYTLFELLNTIEEQRVELTESIDRVIGEQESYIDGRSERWNESVAGDEYKAWRESYVEYSSYIGNVVLEINPFGNIEAATGVTLGLDIGIVDKPEFPEQQPN